MIRVTVELDHGGRGLRVETLAEVLIDNRSLLADVSDYRVRVFGRRGQALPQRTARVSGHRRKSEPVLALVRKALEASGY